MASGNLLYFSRIALQQLRFETLEGSDPYQAAPPAWTTPASVEEDFPRSLFWLEPGTTYDVRVTFSDPDGVPLDGVTVMISGATRSEIAVPPPTDFDYVASDGSGTACKTGVCLADAERLPCTLAAHVRKTLYFPLVAAQRIDSTP